MRRYLFPAIAVTILVAGLLLTSVYTSRELDSTHQTAGSPTTRDNNSGGTLATGGGPAPRDDGKPPAPENRP